MLAAMLQCDDIKEFIDHALVKKVKDNPPEVGDLVHVFRDERRQGYDGIYKSNSTPTSLQAVPLGIVTKAVHQIPVADRMNRLRRYDLDYASDDDFVAVRRLADG
jgi:hypothetical protein